MSGKGDSSLHPKQNRRDQMIIESDHDPYHKKLKLKAPTVCTNCASVFKKGRWTWAPEPKDSEKTMCPACQRTRDKVPAGFLTITHDYIGNRQTEIMNLIHHTIVRERQAHPMKRIMDTVDEDDQLRITFTDPHLARNVGDAVEKAYGGTLDYQYTPGEFILRVKLSN